MPFIKRRTTRALPRRTSITLRKEGNFLTTVGFGGSVDERDGCVSHIERMDIMYSAAYGMGLLVVVVVVVVLMLMFTSFVWFFMIPTMKVTKFHYYILQFFFGAVVFVHSVGSCYLYRLLRTYIYLFYSIYSILYYPFSKYSCY